MEMGFGPAQVPSALSGQVAGGAAPPKPAANALPQTMVSTAQIAQSLLLPSSPFRLTEVARLVVARTAFRPVEPSKSEKEEKKSRASFVQSVVVNKSEACNNRLSK